MLKLNCSSCGAEVIFKSKSSVFGVCSFCKSTLVRQNMNLEVLGKMADLPDDISPLQIGSMGQYENNSFEIIGRVKISWENGFWTEWYISLKDGREGWLAEAQGSYMINFPYEDISKVPSVDKIKVGQNLELIKGIKFDVDDIKKGTCIGSEGELPMTATKGRKNTSVDLSAESSIFACIDYSNEGIKLYTGKYMEFDNLKLSNLRQIDGW